MGALKDRTNGLSVMCHAWAPKSQQHPHSVVRSMCLLDLYEYCPKCENREFVVKLRVYPPEIKEQTVLCPRWERDMPFGHYGDKSPKEYVPVKRDICFNVKPFWLCKYCPNGDKEETPRDKEGWYDKWYKARRRQYER